jgi:hypothetical protein
MGPNIQGSRILGASHCAQPHAPCTEGMTMMTGSSAMVLLRKYDDTRYAPALRSRVTTACRVGVQVRVGSV